MHDRKYSRRKFERRYAMCEVLEPRRLMSAGLAAPSFPKHGDAPNEPALTPILNAGSLDPSFAASSTDPSEVYGVTPNVYFPGFTTSGAHELMQSDGKIVVATTLTSKYGTGLFEVGLVRFNINGSLDTSFGNNGIVEQLVVDGAVGTSVSAIGRQSNGNLVVAGGAEVGGTYQFCVSGFRSDGSFNANFAYGGSDSSANFGPGTSAIPTAMEILPNDDLLLVGICSGHTALAKYDSDGRIDTAFGPLGTGNETLDLGTIDFATGVASSPDGNLIIVGSAHQSSVSLMSITETNSEGIPDTNFGAPAYTTGTETAFFGNGSSTSATCVAISKSGRIVVGTDFSDGSGNHSILSAYTEDGYADWSFGSGGFVSGNNGISSINSIAIQSDNKVLVSGSSSSFTPDTSVTRYTAAGALDTSFTGTGTAIAPPSADLKLDGDGRLTLAGVTSDNSGIYVARLLPGEYAFSGTPFATGQEIPMDHYDNGGEGVAYHDTDSVNFFGPYGRGDGVDVTQPGADGNGIVGYTVPGEYLKYTVSVAQAGTYALSFRGGNVYGSGGTFHVEDTNGNKLTGEITAPYVSGGNYKVFSGGTVNLSAGTHVLKIVFDAESGFESSDLDWFELSAGHAPTIKSLSASAPSVAAGAAVTLTANGVSDADNNLSSVSFYRESNGQSGLQTGSGGDTRITTFSSAPWTAHVPTAGLAPGTYTFYAQATDSTGLTSNVGSCTVNVTKAAGVTGNVFNDANSNGKKDSNEKGLSGWRVYLDTNDDGKYTSNEPSAVTDANGNFTLSGLAAGTYNIRVVQTSGSKATTPSGGDLLLKLSAGQIATGLLFGEHL